MGSVADSVRGPGVRGSFLIPTADGGGGATADQGGREDEARVRGVSLRDPLPGPPLDVAPDLRACSLAEDENKDPLP